MKILQKQRRFYQSILNNKYSKDQPSEKQPTPQEPLKQPPKQNLQDPRLSNITNDQNKISSIPDQNSNLMRSESNDVPVPNSNKSERKEGFVTARKRSTLYMVRQTDESFDND